MNTDGFRGICRVLCPGLQGVIILHGMSTPRRGRFPSLYQLPKVCSVSVRHQAGTVTGPTFRRISCYARAGHRARRQIQQYVHKVWIGTEFRQSLFCQGMRTILAAAVRPSSRSRKACAPSDSGRVSTQLRSPRTPVAMACAAARISAGV